MSDEDYEYVDASEVVHSPRVRNAKPKYTHKLWEADSEKDKARYALAMSNINARRQMIKNGCYNQENDPYAPLISTRYRYEIECETVFHTQEEVVEEVEKEFDYYNDEDFDDYEDEELDESDELICEESIDSDE